MVVKCTLSGSKNAIKAFYKANFQITAKLYSITIPYNMKNSNSSS